MEMRAPEGLPFADKAPGSRTIDSWESLVVNAPASDLPPVNLSENVPLEGFSFDAARSAGGLTQR
jgi:hypothetical protein